MVVGFETGCLAGLLLLGRRSWLSMPWSGLRPWLRVTPAEDAIAACVWIAALGCAIWLTGSTLIYVIARASAAPALIRAVEWMTLPAIRRVTERALGLVLVAATVTATPVLADPPLSFIAVVDRDGTLLPPGLAGPLPVGSERSAGSAGPPLLTNSQEPPTALVSASPGAVQVRSGDNLWVICRRHLTSALGRLPANEEVAPYRRQVIAHNQPHLISGHRSDLPGRSYQTAPRRLKFAVLRILPNDTSGGGDPSVTGRSRVGAGRQPGTQLNLM